MTRYRTELKLSRNSFRSPVRPRASSRIVRVPSFVSPSSFSFIKGGGGGGGGGEERANFAPSASDPKHPTQLFHMGFVHIKAAPPQLGNMVKHESAAVDKGGCQSPCAS